MTIYPLVLLLHQSPNRPEKILIFSEQGEETNKQKKKQKIPQGGAAEDPSDQICRHHS